MESPSLFSVLKVLLLDWRVLVAFAAVLLYLNFIFYIARYRKKPKPPPRVRVKRVTKAEVVASEEGDAENAGSEGAE